MNDAPPSPESCSAAADSSTLPHEPTYDLAVGARALHKSEVWYLRQLARGLLPGHKAGRTWYLTADDIADDIEQTARPAFARPGQAPQRSRPRGGPRRRSRRGRYRPISGSSPPRTTPPPDPRVSQP
ncbi:hypothetical protein [Nocardia wallacei]|uniref:hypothetical protein n=1 Tax=Nocardia wallacei TaxID=480035 RepID=UPI0024581705|nr:hypothetical protein [Nocardia wallacei]